MFPKSEVIIIGNEQAEKAAVFSACLFNPNFTHDLDK